MTPLKKEVLQLIVNIDDTQKFMAKHALEELESREAKCTAAGQLKGMEWIQKILVEIVERDDLRESKEASTDEQEGNQGQQ